MGKSTKLDRLYTDYEFFAQSENAKRALLSAVETCDKQLYYRLQARIFIEMQEPLYKHIAQMLVNDCMKYTGRFKIRTAQAQINEKVLFMENIPEDVKIANAHRLKILNFNF